MKVFLADGRALRYRSSATEGPVVLVFHGTPDTRRIAMTGEEAAAEVGVRLLSFNRPGYGSSTLMPSTHSTVASDAVELLDLWGIDRVAVLGMSVGGTYAAAFAAGYPERTTHLGLVGTPGPQGSEADGSVEEAVERLRPGFLAWRAAIDPDDENDSALAARFLEQLPEADARLLRAWDDEFLGAMCWEALVSPEGYLRDAALLQRAWDFAVADIGCPVSLWVGDQDDQALAGMEWWRSHLSVAPHVEVALGTTHLATLLTQWPAILRRLARGSG